MKIVLKLTLLITVSVFMSCQKQLDEPNQVAQGEPININSAEDWRIKLLIDEEQDKTEIYAKDKLVLYPNHLAGLYKNDGDIVYGGTWSTAFYDSYVNEEDGTSYNTYSFKAIFKDDDSQNVLTIDIEEGIITPTRIYSAGSFSKVICLLEKI